MSLPPTNSTTTFLYHNEIECKINIFPIDEIKKVTKFSKTATFYPHPTSALAKKNYICTLFN